MIGKSAPDGDDRNELPSLTEVLDEIEFFERERTDRQAVELAILLYKIAEPSTAIKSFRRYA